ncbi:hypothetical protein NQ317_009483, partial [Molorchus minor]
VVLVNGCWDTTNKIPNIIAEMHNVNTEEFTHTNSVFKNYFNDSREFINPSPRSSDSGIEADCADGNLSWLLNYKIHELPPVPVTICAGAKNNRKSVLLKEDNRGVGQSYRYSGPKKPPFTYTELIEYALCEKGELTVSGIYQWISDHFPFYKQNDDRWKNSVRHNLSINPHFRKGGKADQGAGHLWTIAQRDNKKSWQIKQRMNQFIHTAYKDSKAQEQEAFDKELQAATESILDEINGHNKANESVAALARQNSNVEVEYIHLEGPNGLEGEYDIIRINYSCVIAFSLIGSTDFLAPPVSKQEIVNECGLGSDFFITDINPNALGLNLTEAEAVTEDGIYEDMGFEYYELKE